MPAVSARRRAATWQSLNRGADYNAPGATGVEWRPRRHVGSRQERDMPNRRDFLRNVAGATAGMVVGGRSLGDGALDALQAPARRRAMIGGRRITVIDIHAHTFVPEVWDVVKDTPLAAAAKNNLTGAIALGPGTAARLQYMDKEGIDYQAINVNAWGYNAERALAR